MTKLPPVSPLGLTPQEVGLPPKFGEWRIGQEGIILEQVASRSRFLSQCSGTGSGKSPNYVAASLIRDERTCILTHTKGLQTQLLSDFSPCGMVDIRGKGNYACTDYPKISCEQAWPKCGAHSPKPEDMGTRCTYQKQLVKARKSNLVSTNYSYWMSINSFGDGMGDFGRLVLDEAHAAPEILADFLSVDLTYRELSEDLQSANHPGEDSPIAEWVEFSRNLLKLAAQYVSEIESMVREGDADDKDLIHLFKYKDLQRRLLSMSLMNGNWIVDTTKESFRFDPVRPAAYAEAILFRGIPNILLTSATIRPKTLSLLGVGQDAANSCFTEHPSSFPSANSPLLYVRDSPKMGAKEISENPSTMRDWMGTVDSIIAGRMDRKGIIHTVSFDLLRYLVANSSYSHLISTNGNVFAGGDRRTDEVIANFKSSREPSILASPSVSTGFDFPGRQCEYQIIAKLPYVPSVSKIAKARRAMDKEYYDYLTAQQLVQMCGRGTRGPNDKCENFIIDSRITFFMRNRHLFPSDFAARYRPVQLIPPAPERVRDTWE